MDLGVGVVKKQEGMGVVKKQEAVAMDSAGDDRSLVRLVPRKVGLMCQAVAECAGTGTYAKVIGVDGSIGSRGGKWSFSEVNPARCTTGVVGWASM